MESFCFCRNSHGTSVFCTSVISIILYPLYRSDVLGQFMPLVGIDWSQTGVAHLFSAIKVCAMVLHLFFFSLILQLDPLYLIKLLLKYSIFCCREKNKDFGGTCLSP